MKTRTIPILTAIAMMVALCVPAIGHATEPLITNSNGEAAGSVFATSENILIKGTGGGRITCTTTNISTTLTQNTNLTADGHGTGESIGNPDVTPKTHLGDCATNNSEVTARITNWIVNKIHLESTQPEGATGTSSFSFTYDLIHHTFGIIGECKLVGEAHLVAATFSDELFITATLVKTTGATPPCPNTGELEGQFTLTDEFGLPVVIE